MNSGDWRRRSIQSVWHPYTEITAFEQADFPVVDRAEGSTLYDVEGRALLDGISSWWCVNLGHGHPRLVKAIREQAGRLQHTLLGGMSHPPAILLAEQLARIAPAGLGHAMFGGDGSLAVEAALKIALQYRDNRGEAGRSLFIALEDGYHGDTLGAIGAGYIEAFHRPFSVAVQPALRAMSPHCACCPFGLRPDSCHVKCFDSMNGLIAEHHARCTAVIVEPLCQAAAGMRVYPAAYLQRLRKACDQYGLLLIADEIAVGFGRTGAMFACERAGIRPDIMTIGKGLTGGMLPMSATLVTDAVYDTFRADDRGTHTLHHGTTFCGNPITSAVALAALAVYEEERIVAQLEEPSRRLQKGMAGVAALLDDSPVSAVGMIAAVEIKASCGGAVRAREIVRRAREGGLLIRPLGATIYLWPPLNVTGGDLTRMLDIMHEAARATKA
jgi:adenosylmethionine-8-amino-7-oxononanoate aminotransferase